MEKLGERVDALTHSVELLAAFHHDLDLKWEERWAKSEERMGKLVDAMTQLAHIVGNHERRLNDLERPQ